MSFVTVAAVAGGATIVGGILQANAAQNAANTEAGAANNATSVQQQEFNQVQANEAPYRAAGTAALSQMQNPAFQQGFTSGDFYTQPGYQFALQQGQNALNAQEAAGGTYTSGAGLAATDAYNVGMANQQYQQAFQNFNTTNSLNYGRLSTLASLGAGANTTQASAGANAANQIGTNLQNAGEAQAAGQVGTANAATNSIQGLSQAYGGYSTLSALQANSPTTGGGTQLGVAPGSTQSIYSPQQGQVQYDPSMGSLTSLGTTY
jgi:hypothetical protein